MNRSQTAALLSLCAAYDSRTIGEADVLAWHDLLVDASYDDATTAVKSHYAREKARIMPADVLAGIRRIRRDRLDAADSSFLFLGDPDDTTEYQRQLAEHRRAVADGQPVEPLALTGTSPPAEIHDLARRKSLPKGKRP